MNENFVEFDTFLAYDSRVFPWNQMNRMGRMKCRVERIAGMVQISYFKGGKCMIQWFVNPQIPAHPPKRNRIISELPDLGTVYSNCDHVLNQEVAEALKDGGEAVHPGWNFYGYITFKDGEYWEEVWHHHQLIDTIIRTDIMDCINRTNEKYGHD